MRLLKTHSLKEAKLKKVPEITEALIEEAKRTPSGWVYHIDWDYRADQHVPPEAIVGAWEVDGSGKLGEFKFNDNYRAVIIAKRQPRDYMKRTLTSRDAAEWLIEADPQYDDLFPAFPPEGITGRWYVGEDGKFTGQFRPNPHYKGKIKT